MSTATSILARTWTIKCKGKVQNTRTELYHSHAIHKYIYILDTQSAEIPRRAVGYRRSGDVGRRRKWTICTVLSFWTNRTMGLLSFALQMSMIKLEVYAGNAEWSAKLQFIIGPPQTQYYYTSLLIGSSFYSNIPIFEIQAHIISLLRFGPSLKLKYKNYFFINLEH